MVDFSTGPGMIDDTVTHLLVVNFNHLKISIQLTVKAHQRATEQEFLFQQHWLCIHHLHSHSECCQSLYPANDV